MGLGTGPSLLLELPSESSQVQYLVEDPEDLELLAALGILDDRLVPPSPSHTRVLASLSLRVGRWGSTLQGGCTGWCRSLAGKRRQRRGLRSRQRCSQPPPRRGCFQGRHSRSCPAYHSSCHQSSLRSCTRPPVALGPGREWRRHWRTPAPTPSSGADEPWLVRSPRWWGGRGHSFEQMPAVPGHVRSSLPSPALGPLRLPGLRLGD